MTPEMWAAFLRAWPYGLMSFLTVAVALIGDATITWRTFLAASLGPALANFTYRWLGEHALDIRKANVERAEKKRINDKGRKR